MLGLRTSRQYPSLPSMPATGIMPPSIGVIIPIARTNLVTNPSIELATTGYTTVGSSIARSNTHQYHGTYSLAVTPTSVPTDGAYYGPITLAASTTYAFSCKFRATGDGIGQSYRFTMATTGAVDMSAVTFVATGRWQWIYGYHYEAAGGARRFYFRKDTQASVAPFYIDGVQIEAINAGETVSTYIDGDQPGLLVGQQPPPYLWTGTPHGSTSTRSILTRAGGYILNLETAYNFLLTGIIGLGMATPNNVSIPYTVLDGARFLRTTKPPRTISLPGRFQADDFFTLQQSISDMRQAFDRDLMPIQQPMILTVEPRDDCGNVIGNFAQVQCLYAGGLEGNDTNLPIQDAAPTFTMYIPFLIGGDTGAPLGVQTTVANANAIIQRSPAGVYTALTTGVAGGAVRAIVRAADGSFYMGGTFTSAGGVANTRSVAKWNGTAWSALGTGANGDVFGLALDSLGNLYAVGAFSLMGGVANTVRVAKWNGTAWSALGTGANDIVTAVVVDNSNNVYIGGQFTLAGGVANTVRVAKWNGTAWSALTTGVIGSIVFALQFGIDRNLYVAGVFATAGGVGSSGIVKYNPTTSTWSTMGGGVSGGTSSVNSLAAGADGTIYLGGNFTSAGGTVVSNIATWNGTTFSSMGGGVGIQSVSTVQAIFPTPQGILVSGQNITTAGNITTVDSLALWTGSAWLPLDINFPSTSTIYSMYQGLDGTILFGFDSLGTATTIVNTTVVNDTPAVVWPVLKISGPTTGTAAVYKIANQTIGATMYFAGVVAAGETVTIAFNPSAPLLSSDFPWTNQGLAPGTPLRLLPGSATIYLAPGSNIISFFASQSTVVATLTWQSRYNGFADLVN